MIATAEVSDISRPPRILLLGPVELRGARAAHPIGGMKLRAILAQLALAEGRVVPAEQLIDGVWGDSASSTARNTLQYHVGILRKALAGAGAGEALTTRSPGYSVQLPTDLAEFAAQRAAGNRAVSNGQAAEAADCYARALRCWRGSALADLMDFPFARARAVALDAQRMTCLEAWCDAELECGHADALVPQLQGLVVEHPGRERLWEQLMIGLFRTGRSADALATYRRARKYLDEELGVDPSQRLKDVHQAVLTQEGSLLGPSASAAPVVQVPSSVRTRLSAAQPAERAALTGPSGLRLVLAAEIAVLGRHSGCDLVLADEEASRRHARIVATSAGHAVEDLGSTNGTLLNGVPITSATDLKQGDRIEIGLLVLRYHEAVE